MPKSLLYSRFAVRFLIVFTLAVLCGLFAWASLSLGDRPRNAAQGGLGVAFAIVFSAMAALLIWAAVAYARRPPAVLRSYDQAILSDQREIVSRLAKMRRRARSRRFSVDIGNHRELHVAWPPWYQLVWGFLCFCFVSRISGAVAFGFSPDQDTAPEGRYPAIDENYLFSRFGGAVIAEAANPRAQSQLHRADYQPLLGTVIAASRRPHP